MRIASSLTNRVFLACTLLAVLSIGFAFYFVDERASSQAEGDLQRGLAEAGTLLDRYGATRTDHFMRLARVVADLPKLKAAVDTGDPPTVQPLAEEYRAEMGADLLVLTGHLGTVLGATGADEVTLAAVEQDPRSLEQLSTFAPHRRGVLELVSVPILIEDALPDLLGRLTVGVFLDDRLAAEFKDLTGSDIAFGVQGRILASTLAEDGRRALEPVLSASTTRSIAIGGEEFLVLARPLLSADGAPHATAAALVLRSRTRGLEFLAAIRARLAGLMVVALLLATLLSYGVARTMTRPLAAVTTAMREVATTGDLTHKVALKSRAWDDEDARLLASTFNTLTESVTRFQHEGAHKDRLSSLGRLSTVIAHEIRNPLMIIRASLSTLRSDQATPSERGEAISDIDEETTRLNRVVTEVLDFARPIRFDLAECDLNEICRDSADAAWTGAPSAVLALDLDSALPPVVTDAERLRTALVNVLANARWAVLADARADTGTDGPTIGTTASPPDVVLRSRTSADRVIIAIRDRGAGIAAADMAHIFDPYFTTRRAGTGLGLPIAKNIIEGLGGTVNVSSAPGEGTEIRIDLPHVPPGARS